MQIEIRGEGELVLRFIDKKGVTLMQERLTVSGSPDVTAMRVVDLVLRTAKGEAQVAPVIVSRSNPDQAVRFDGDDPPQFIKRRCKEIGCATKVAADAARGAAPDVVTKGKPSLMNDAAVLAKLIKPSASTGR
jgi:hypothetical protein